MKKLIIVADDFGYHSAVNEGIIISSQKGIVTSASVMVYGPAMADVRRFHQKLPKFDLGLHLVVEERLAQSEVKPIFQSFSQQFSLFEKMFRQKPSNLSFHQASFLSRYDPEKIGFTVNCALKILEDKTGISSRDKLVDKAITLKVESSLSKTITSLLKVIKGANSKRILLITHPGVYRKCSFASSYPLRLREKETGVLTNKTIVSMLVLKGLDLVDFHSLEEVVSNEEREIRKTNS